MTVSQLRELGRSLNPVFSLERVLSHEKRSRIKLWLQPICFVLIAVGIAVRFTSYVVFDHYLFSAGLLALVILIIVYLSEAYYFSKMIRELARESGPSLSLSESMFQLIETDVTGSFFTSKMGIHLAERLGISLQDLSAYISSERELLSAGTTTVEESNIVGLALFLRAIFKTDASLRTFLLKYGVIEGTLADAASWVESERILSLRKARWWSKTYLIRGGGLGESLSYGRAFTLSRYARVIDGGTVLLPGAITDAEDTEIKLIEGALLRSANTNVFVVSDDHFESVGILGLLAEEINERRSSPSLFHYKINLVDSTALLSASESIGNFTQELMRILYEASMAGNIILAMDNFPSLVRYATAHQSDLGDILVDYLSSGSLPLIAIGNRKDFQDLIEQNIKLKQYFEVVKLSERSGPAMLRTLEQLAMDVEYRSNLIFSIQALNEAAASLAHYFLGDVSTGRAREILQELPQEAINAGRYIVTQEDVGKVITRKSGVPTGSVTEAESDKLLHLEDILRAKIIGQEEAIGAIAKAMRRARVGLESATRPLGSFLFLGSTGVGKTETAKVLSNVFFGDKTNMMRLDMSEYSGSDALSRLIGVSSSSRVGSLTMLLRENHYGVLLLDEFEKAGSDVHNLFLQILDEGYFTDAAGSQVNARNTIIIATSNAGADTLWRLINEGKSVLEYKQTLIDNLIANKIFRPELLNRFDEVVIFKPLANKELEGIAALMLEELKKKVSGKALDLVVTPELINFIITHGSDKAFGARPMRRAIQDNLEESIARALLAKTITPGDKICLDPDPTGTQIFARKC